MRSLAGQIDHVIAPAGQIFAETVQQGMRKDGKNEDAHTKKAAPAPWRGFH